MLRDIIRQLLTESDNVTHDIYRYLAVISIAVGLSLSIYSVVKGQPFDMQTFGIGVGSLFAGGAISKGVGIAGRLAGVGRTATASMMPAAIGAMEGGSA